MPNATRPSFDNDEVNSGDRHDRLGFKLLAEKLSISILDQATAGGIVIGIEGKWGSGKSSLMRRIETELAKHVHAPEIINFAPWLIGSRAALIEALIAQLTAAVNKIETAEREAGAEEVDQPKGRPKKKSTTEKIRMARGSAEKALSQYGENMGKLGKLAKIAGLVVPGAELVGTALERSAELMAAIGQPKELKGQKEAVAQALRALSRRIIVFIDDLDRLEPSETVEVLRLVRAVADFPNVLYILSYDREAVTRALEAALKIGDGIEYLEKFIQVSFKVPKQEDFDLRRWFRDEATSILSAQLAAARESDRRDIGRRLDQYIDVAGGRYLHTPRDVIRSLNALKLYGPPVADLIDIPDLVWLQLVRANDANLYDWVEAYATTAAAVSAGATVSDSECRKVLDKLKAILGGQDRTLEDAIWELHDKLPGINWDTDKEKYPDGWKMLESLSDERVRSWVARRRLGSPQHFRYYFALAQPQGVVADNEVMKLVELACTSRAATAASLASIAKTKRAVSGVALDPLISRLLALSSEDLPTTSIPNILLGLADVMDEASVISGQGRWGMNWLAMSAERAFREFLKRLSEDTRCQTIHEVFSRGEALGWVGGLLADDIFARGLAGEGNRGSHEPFFANDEFETARAILVNRFKSLPPEKIMDVPRLPSVLYAWKYLSNNDAEVRDWCARQTETDEGLLRFLSKSRGWANASGVGIYYPLNKRTISDFIDCDAARARVQKLARNPNMRALAEELSLAFRQGERD